MTTADRGDAPGLGALPQHAEARNALPDPEGWWAEVNSLDLAVYAAIAATPTPTLDRVFRRLSRAADHSKLWIASAAVLATIGGPGGRRAAVNGLASVAVTSAVVNLVLKPLGRRHRPDRATHHVPITRQVTMPRTTSFPSGHAAGECLGEPDAEAAGGAGSTHGGHGRRVGTGRGSVGIGGASVPDQVKWSAGRRCRRAAGLADSSVRRGGRGRPAFRAGFCRGGAVGRPGPVQGPRWLASLSQELRLIVGTVVLAGGPADHQADAPALEAEYWGCSAAGGMM